MNVNPYLFLLLKRIIDEEIFEREGRYLSKEDIAYKISEFIFKEKNAANYQAGQFRKILSLKDFDVSQDFLNYMARFANLTSQYLSWIDFSAKQANSFFLVGYLFSSMPYTKLHRDQRRLIQFLVERRISDIFLRVPPSLERYDQIILNLKSMYSPKRRIKQEVNMSVVFKILEQPNDALSLLYFPQIVRTLIKNDIDVIDVMTRFNDNIEAILSSFDIAQREAEKKIRAIEDEEFKNLLDLSNDDED